MQKLQLVSMQPGSRIASHCCFATTGEIDALCEGDIAFMLLFGAIPLDIILAPAKLRSQAILLSKYYFIVLFFYIPGQLDMQTTIAQLVCLLVYYI